MTCTSPRQPQPFGTFRTWDQLMGAGNQAMPRRIDEAGRGPVPGPMVYACFYCPHDRQHLLETFGIDDSKKLTPEQRQNMFDTIHENQNLFGWRIHSISPEELSAKMLRRTKCNLNQISHSSAIELIQHTIDQGVRVTKVIVDTVGNPEIYQRKLSQRFPYVSFTVTEKADALYKVVGAASVLAKVTRDRHTQDWKFPEVDGGQLFPNSFGNGYPSDPQTRAFLEGSFDKVFGFPSFVRHSWSTAKDYIDKHGHKVEWYEPENEACTSKPNASLCTFFQPRPADGAPVVPRSQFFKKNRIEVVTRI
eukprot:GHVT01076406.1.p1 GENE.GHVT01076406.1~~GHVT01076406.1.p1  ORF type:complete len:306 (+),score=39.03 GHVT01076406.1:805-1722(+)